MLHYYRSAFYFVVAVIGYVLCSLTGTALQAPSTSYELPFGPNLFFPSQVKTDFRGFATAPTSFKVEPSDEITVDFSCPRRPSLLSRDNFSPTSPRLKISSQPAKMAGITSSAVNGHEVNQPKLAS